MKRTRAQIRAAKRRDYAERTLLGICVKCKRLAVNCSVYCGFHQIKNREKAMRYYYERKVVT